MLIVEFGIDSPILVSACREAPGTRLTYQEQYRRGEDIIFIFWAETDDFETLEAALEADPTVTGETVLTETPTRRLYRVRFTERGVEIATFPVWSELDLILLDSTLTADGWEVRMGFPDREALEQYREECDDLGLSFDPRSVYLERDTLESASEAALSPPQREALSLALEEGYFDVPRATTLTELSRKMGISDTSLSERLRRGQRALLETSLDHP